MPLYSCTQGSLTSLCTRHHGSRKGHSVCADSLLYNSSILLFLVNDYELNNTEKLGISILMSKADKFESKLNDLRGAAELVDKEIQTRGAFRFTSALERNHTDPCSYLLGSHPSQ